MLRLFRLLFVIVTGLVLLVLALANRAPVTLRLLPDDMATLMGAAVAYELPLFLVILAAVAAGVLIGFVWEWFREMSIRTQARTASREVARLEREIAVMKDSASVPKDEVLAILDGAVAGRPGPG
jgi:lipopolysaccharide assembly protein A